MRKMLMLLMMACLLLGSAQAEEMVEIDVMVTQGAMEGVTMTEGENAALDALFIQDFDGDGEVTLAEIDERIACTWRCEDEAIALATDTRFTQWFSEGGTGFGYPIARIQQTPASAEGKRIWCELEDKATGERRVIQYTLHLDGLIAQEPDISPEPIHLGANRWEVQVEEGTEVSIQLVDSLRETWDGELTYRWYKRKFEADTGWAESAAFENDGDSLTFAASLEDDGWSYEWQLTSQNRTTGEYAGHVGQLLVYVHPKGEKPPEGPLTASGTIPYENGMILHSVYHEILDGAGLPYSERTEWMERLILSASEGLTFSWMTEDAALQEMLDSHRGAGQHLMFELTEEEAKRLIDHEIPFTCTITEASTGETLANLTYTLVEP